MLWYGMDGIAVAYIFSYVISDQKGHSLDLHRQQVFCTYFQLGVSDPPEIRVGQGFVHSQSLVWVEVKQTNKQVYGVGRGTGISLGEVLHEQ